jgi:hypothetical protein
VVAEGKAHHPHEQQRQETGDPIYDHGCGYPFGVRFPHAEFKNFEGLSSDGSARHKERIKPCYEIVLIKLQQFVFPDQLMPFIGVGEEIEKGDEIDDKKEIQGRRHDGFKNLMEFISCEYPPEQTCTDEDSE